MDQFRVCGGPALIRVLMRMMFGNRTWIWMCVGERHFEEQYCIVLLRDICVKQKAAKQMN